LDKVLETAILEKIERVA
jgi:hypothetical protein